MQLFKGLKKAFGFGKSELDQEVDNFSVTGTLYKIEDDQRTTLFEQSLIQFEKNGPGYLIHFRNNGSGEKKDYFFPVHESMKLVSFNLAADTIVQTCFEWILAPDDQSQVGCHMNTEAAAKFKQLFCMLINEISHSKKEDLQQYCRDLKEMPGSSKAEPQTRPSEKQQGLSKIMMDEASKQQTKLANTGRLYYIRHQIRTQINPSVVFTIKSSSPFIYSIYVYDCNGYKILQKQITRSLNYQTNIQNSYIKWLDVGADVKIVEVRFDRFDAVINVRFQMQVCLYEMGTKKLMKDDIDEEETNYIKDMSNEVKYNQNVVKLYEDPGVMKIEKPPKELETEIKSVFEGFEKYEDKRVLCQAKIADCSIVSLANNLEMLVIDEDNKLKRVEATKIKGLKNEDIIPRKIVMYDEDSKAMMSAEDNNMYSFDMNELKIIDKYTPSKEGLRDLVPESKMAELGKYNTFLGVNEDTIFQLDPRVGKTGLAEKRNYATNPMFTHITTTAQGNYAVGSEDGTLRLYRKDVEPKKNATNKYPALSDPVRSLDTTKDGKWLLATYDKYLILLPTFNEDETDLYTKTTKINNRPKPKKLQIKVQHLSLCKVKEVKLLPAKFDESKGDVEKFIVSGFDEYIVIWSLSKILRGDTSYTFSKTNDPLSNAEFKFNDINKLIMTTPHKVKLQQNELSK